MVFTSGIGTIERSKIEDVGMNIQNGSNKNPSIDVFLESETKRFKIEQKYIGDLSVLKEHVRQLLEIAKNEPVYLYEKITISGEETLLRLLTQPLISPEGNDSMVLVYSPKRMSPRMTRKVATVSSSSSILKVKFPEFYRILEELVTIQKINQLNRVIFEPAEKYLGVLTKKPDLLIPLVVDRVAKKKDVNFTFLQERTNEMDQLDNRIYKNGFDKNCISFVNMLAASGAGKTTTVMGVGMTKRMCYVDCSIAAEINAFRFALEFTMNSKPITSGDALKLWFLARTMLLVYLQEKYDFDCVDLMAAQLSEEFAILYKKILCVLLEDYRNDNNFEFSYKDFALTFPTPVCLDECHVALNAFLYHPSSNPGNFFSIFSAIVSALSNEEKLPMSLILITTLLKPFVYQRMMSASQKAHLPDISTSKFTIFPFHKKPTLLLDYLSTVPEKIQQMLMGRARFGAMFLHLVISRLSTISSYSTHEEFLLAILDDYVAFNTQNNYDRGDLLRDSSKSIRGIFQFYLSGNDNTFRPPEVKSFLVKVYLSSICSKNFAVSQSDLNLLLNGALFLDQAVDENCKELVMDNIEPFTLMAIENMFTPQDLVDSFHARLMDTLQKYDAKEPSKGIDFQYLFMLCLLNKKGQNLLSLIAQCSNGTETVQSLLECTQTWLI